MKKSRVKRSGIGVAEKQDIEQLLREGKTIQLFPEGYSMYPMFVPGRDEAVIAGVKPEKLRRGDVVLYRRKMGILVLHRLAKKDACGFYMVGDNQTMLEGPIASEQLCGILVGFIRKGHYIKVSNPCYRLLSGFWLRIRPLRRPIQKSAAAIKRLFS